jgi:hypothetical protein
MVVARKVPTSPWLAETLFQSLFDVFKIRAPEVVDSLVETGFPSFATQTLRHFTDFSNIKNLRNRCEPTTIGSLDTYMTIKVQLHQEQNPLFWNGLNMYRYKGSSKCFGYCPTYY